MGAGKKKGKKKRGSKKMEKEMMQASMAGSLQQPTGLGGANGSGASGY